MHGRSTLTKVLANAAISSAGLAAQGLARFVYTIAIGRVAGPELLGETSALLAIAVFAALFWPAPAGLAASRFLPLQGMANAAVSVLRKSLIPSILLISIAAYLASISLGSGWAMALGCVAVTIGYSAYVFVRGCLLGENRVTRIAVADTLTSLIGIAILIFVLAAKLHWMLLLPLAISYALFALFSWARQSEVPNKRQKSEILIFTRDSAVASVATGGLLPAASMLILAFDTPQVAGFFAAGLSLATPANQVAQALSQVLVPQFAGMPAEDFKLKRKLLLRMLLLSAIGFGVVFGLLIALAFFIIQVFYGQDYLPGTLPMQIIMFGVGCMSMVAAPLAYLQATGHQKLNARIWAIALGAALSVMIITGPSLGQWGVLTGFLIGSLGGSVAVLFSAVNLSRLPK